MLSVHAEAIRRQVDGSKKSKSIDPSWARLSSAIDTIAAQRDAYTSGLYWYTELPTAEAAARVAGKPILSLRMLGNLNEEFSCANSRFFRSALYANAEVSTYLRDHFILHWQSVRPVPVITIDFGDGRKIRRTITGNSIHYVLSADGTVIDGIPGLYGPKAFLRELTAATDAAEKFSDITSDLVRMDFLQSWHASQADDIQKSYQADLARLQINAPTSTTDEAWEKIAELHREDATLDAGSTALVAAKTPTALDASRFAISKSRVEMQLVRMIGNFEQSLAMDTVRNQYTFHLQIHRWLADPAENSMAKNVATLNRRVYAELFLTPDSDPWLGLVPLNVYSALDDGGVSR